MISRLSIYHPTGEAALGANVFGKDVANFELFQAIVRHGGLEQVDFLTHTDVSAEGLAQNLAAGSPLATRISTSNILNQSVPAASGSLLRGSLRLDELAWQRRRGLGDHGYSLMGLVHTIAPPGMRQDIAMTAVAPLQIWDALICTSPAVRSAIEALFDEWGDYLAERFGGDKRRRPRLPLIPLGVKGETFRALADRPDARQAVRARLGAAEDDVVVLWVGRLSFFEKAFPQPMMRAVTEAAAKSGRRVHFVMAGWFPNGEQDEAQYRQAAAAHAPDLPFHILDGNDRSLLGELWAGSDIFLSLVDNIQETFGITPLEAMAAGLPVVASDWDGYRYTLRHGQEGFLIPTLGAPRGSLSTDLAAGHALGLISYQQYVGVVAQHTAVHVGAAADALVALILNPDLRRRMGEAGRRRIAETFDWSVVAPLYTSLADELGEIRRAANPQPCRPAPHPYKGDPLHDFAGFASAQLDLDARLRLRSDKGLQDLMLMNGVELDRFGQGWRGTPEECETIINHLAAGPLSARAILATFPPNRRRKAALNIMWLAKSGLIDWDPAFTTG